MGKAKKKKRAYGRLRRKQETHWVKMTGKNSLISGFLGRRIQILQGVVEVLSYSIKELINVPPLHICLAGYKHSWGENLPVLQLHYVCQR